MLENEVVPVMEKKHSGMGIASFVTSIVIGLSIMMCYFFIAFKTVASGGSIDSHSSFAIVTGLIILGLIMFDMIALGLGIAGVIQKDRKKIYAILGIIISAAMILSVVVLMFIGLAHQAG